MPFEDLGFAKISIITGGLRAGTFFDGVILLQEKKSRSGRANL